jgi:hypothetical protein
MIGALRFGGDAGVVVPAGTERQFRHEVSETYLDDPVEVPVTVVNGEVDGPPS